MARLGYRRPAFLSIFSTCPCQREADDAHSCSKIVLLENRPVDKSCLVPYNGTADARECTKDEPIEVRGHLLECLAGARWGLEEAES